MNSLIALREAIDQQIQKLTRVWELLGSVESAGSETKSFDQVSVSEKVGQTVLGVLLSAVLPFPGTIEVGVASMSMLWLESDLAGRHLAVEHQKTSGADGPYRRFDQRPKVQSLKMLQAWVEGGHDEVALVHNATARVLTVRLVNGEVSLMQSAYKKIQDAHPFMNLVTKTVESGITAVAGAGVELPVVVIEPTDLAVVRLPGEALAIEESERRIFDLDFAYGMGRNVERSIGRVRAKPGSAVSFICLDRELHINNSEDFCKEEYSIPSIALESPNGIDATHDITQASSSVDVHANEDGNNGVALASSGLEDNGREGLCKLGAKAPITSETSVDASSTLSSNADKHPSATRSDEPTLVAQATIAASDSTVGESPDEKNSDVAEPTQTVSKDNLTAVTDDEVDDSSRTCADDEKAETKAADPSLISSSTRASAGDEEQSTQPLLDAVSNEDGIHQWNLPLPSSSDEPEPGGEQHDNQTSEDVEVGGTIEVINRDFKPITLNFYKQAALVGHMFDRALKIAVVSPGESQILRIPLLATADSADRSPSNAQTPGSTNPDPFEVEVVSSTGKSLCNARWGQIIIYEGVLH